MGAFSKEFWITIAACIPFILWAFLIAQSRGQGITIPAIQFTVLIVGVIFIWREGERISETVTRSIRHVCGTLNPESWRVRLRGTEALGRRGNMYQPKLNDQRPKHHVNPLILETTRFPPMSSVYIVETAFRQMRFSVVAADGSNGE